MTVFEEADCMSSAWQAFLVQRALAASNPTRIFNSTIAIKQKNCKNYLSENDKQYIKNYSSSPIFNFYTPFPRYLACSQYMQKLLCSLSWLTFLLNLLIAGISYHLQHVLFHKDIARCLTNQQKRKDLREMFMCMLNASDVFVHI